MLPRRLLFAALGIGLVGLVAGCLHDDDDQATGDAQTRTQDLKQFVADDIANRSSDTAAPVEINDLDLDMSDENPAQYDDLLQSG